MKIIATIFRVTIAFILTLVLGCNNQPGDTSGRRKSTAFVDTPRSFVKNYGVNDSKRLFVFVGEKIVVEPLPLKARSMDNSYKEKYAILPKCMVNFLKIPLSLLSRTIMEYLLFQHSKNDRVIGPRWDDLLAIRKLLEAKKSP